MIDGRRETCERLRRAYSTWGRQIGVSVRVLAVADATEEAVVETVGRGGGGRVKVIGRDGGGWLVVEIVEDVEWRGGRHPSRSPRKGIETLCGPEIHKQGIGFTTKHHNARSMGNLNK